MSERDFFVGTFPLLLSGVASQLRDSAWPPRGELPETHYMIERIRTGAVSQERDDHGE